MQDPYDPRADVRQRLTKACASEEAGKYLEREVYNGSLFRATGLNVRARWDVPAFLGLYRQMAQTALFAVPQWRPMLQRTPRETAHRLMHATPMERDPQTWEDARVSDREGMERCRKCNSDRTTYTAVQLRSSDEPMTLMFRCKQCGNTWKQ